MSLREFFLENLAGDLEYHPRRAAVYLFLGVTALAFWIFSPSENKFTTTPLVFALGSLTFLGKGIFLLRKSSEGLGLSQLELDALSNAAKQKNLPALPEQTAQVVQDFGTGSLLLWPLLNIGKDVDASWTEPPRFQVFLTGAFLFALGWFVRRATSKRN